MIQKRAAKAARFFLPWLTRVWQYLKINQ